MKLRAGLAVFLIFVQCQSAMILESMTISRKEAATLAESGAWKSPSLILSNDPKEA